MIQRTSVLQRLVLSIVLASGAAQQAPAEGADVSRHEFSLPLDHGRLHLREIFIKISDELGIAAPQSVQDLDWSIDVESTLGKIQLHLFDRLAQGVIDTSVQGDHVFVAVDRAKLEETLSKTGQSFEAWLADLGSDTRQRQQRAYGVSFINESGDVDSRVLLAQLPHPPQRVVVLIHGLDDPGFMWRDLIPVLHEAGRAVARFEYPNDGPIADSADLLATSLAELRKAGVTHVDMVSHSMGGLVARDVLTRGAYYAGDGGGGHQYPAVDRLIMLGPPNHGSTLARLRGVAEFREHLYRAMHGEGDWFSTLADDGAGEAGVDLLPESDFLRRLNDRPLPSHTKMTIIAGQWSPVASDDLQRCIDQVRKFAESDSAPEWLRDLIDEDTGELATSLVCGAVNGLGDGCVKIDATRLDGVDDFKIVSGNHLSMLVNLKPAPGCMPTAVPVILDRLTK